MGRQRCVWQASARSAECLTTISYCYPAQYELPPDVKKCFATPSGQIMEQYIASRKETKRTQIWEGKIGAFDILSLGIAAGV